MRQVKISAPVSYWHLPNAMIYLHQKFWPASGVIIVNFSTILRAMITKTFATLCAMAGAALSLRENHFLRVRAKFLCLFLLNAQMTCPFDQIRQTTLSITRKFKKALQ